MLLAAPVSERPTRVEAPVIKHTGTVERGGSVYLQFEVTNLNDAALHYHGYTSHSIEGGLKDGAITPLYRLETKRGRGAAVAVLGAKRGVGPVIYGPSSAVA